MKKEDVKTPEVEKVDLEKVISEKEQAPEYKVTVDINDLNNLAIIVNSLGDILSVKQGREIVSYLETLGRRMADVLPQPEKQ